MAHCAIDGNGLRSGNTLRDRDSGFPHLSTDQLQFKTITKLTIWNPLLFNQIIILPRSIDQAQGWWDGRLFNSWNAGWKNLHVTVPAGGKV
jgi:hypothetical protein